MLLVVSVMLLNVLIMLLDYLACCACKQLLELSAVICPVRSSAKTLDLNSTCISLPPK
jgi:hypothetical protein